MIHFGDRTGNKAVIRDLTADANTNINFLFNHIRNGIGKPQIKVNFRMFLRNLS